MLSTSAFDPLSRSMIPMLKEESYHLGTGNNGLLRIVKAGRMPPEVIQRFFYKWIPTAFDLFGTDNSSSAHWAYVWGLKGRYDEREHQDEPEKSRLNELSRELYRQEIAKLVERLNLFIPERERQLHHALERGPDSHTATAERGVRADARRRAGSGRCGAAGVRRGQVAAPIVRRAVARGARGRGVRPLRRPQLRPPDRETAGARPADARAGRVARLLPVAAAGRARGYRGDRPVGGADPDRRRAGRHAASCGAPDLRLDRKRPRRHAPPGRAPGRRRVRQLP